MDSRTKPKADGEDHHEDLQRQDQDESGSEQESRNNKRKNTVKDDIDVNDIKEDDKVSLT